MLHVLAQEPYPAADYRGTWTVIALLLLAGVAAWYAVVFVTTREPSPTPVYTPPPAPRLDHLGEIPLVEAPLAAGQLGSRETHP